MSSNTQAATGGLSLSGVLGVVFIVLKLTGVISWSWWWVLAPFWLPALVAVAFGLISLFVILLASR